MASSYGTDADKSSLRFNYLTARRRIDPATKVALDARILERLAGFGIYADAGLVLAYVSYGNEVDTRVVIESALASGKRVAVPRVLPHKHKMDFYEIDGMDLAEGFKGILEPKRGFCSPLGTVDLLGSVCLVPGLVFDAAGHRIGYGGGYYDRAVLRQQSAGQREAQCTFYGVPYGTYVLSENGVRTTRVGNFPAFLASAAKVVLSVGPVADGFEAENPAIAVLTESELYDIRATRRRSRIRDTGARVEAAIRDISELKPGDPVVHLDHGVGRYCGLETIQSDEGASEFVRIDYANNAKLFVPVSQLHLISRYTGADSEHAPLHNLGKGDWEKAKKKAAQKVRDTAAELLNLYALRESRTGFAFLKHTAEYEAFCEGFPFEETPDQASAITAVIEDMAQPRPMDRLVCGDVGFGKTEVALRAAFVAAMNGKQVVVLCPTTLLAEQHAQTFRDRFAAWPIKIAELSRFRSGKETTAALEGLKDGTIDIAVGTHKLLGEKVAFARLGLIIIDEEHRFGVRQKEKLKSLRAEVDVLTLTATPIPRTLAMSLEGIRDFSVIATAPEKRLAIKTFVRRESDELIREAVIRELKRGGQVYFLHNEVSTIEARKERLEKLLPEARIAVAHGQMSERELEHIMRDFYQQRFNVLLCTTIIETGIDVANANTILIHRADMFGLAQLHQLRGRVGRSHHQAYAYLMTPGDDAVTKNAVKRLEAIQNLEDLGSGFYLSMHDLEIRGAGEVLGDEQSGEIADVGFDLYNQMLKAAVRAMKRGETPDFAMPFAAMSEINLHLPALLPSDYVPDVASRLGLYKELAAADNLTELEHVIDDLNDRFGMMPDSKK